MTRTAIILAAGASSRMKNSLSPEGLSPELAAMASSRSKALIELDDSKRPVLDFLLKHMKQAGVTDILLVVGEDHDSFKLLYGSREKNNSYEGLNLSYAVQHIANGRIKPMGTADAVCQTLEQYPELKEKSFLVCNSDNLYSVEAIKKLLFSTSSNALIAYDRDSLNFSDERISRFALMQIDKNQLKAIVEKPRLEDMPAYRDASGKYRVSMNIFKFDGYLFYPFLRDCPLHPERDEKELPTALMNMIGSRPGQCEVISMEEHVPDLTSKADIAEFLTYLRNHRE